MNKLLLISLAGILSMQPSFAQEVPDSLHREWVISADANFYLIPGDFFVLPVVRADQNHLHLEARYNYEDRETFSGWAGYNFNGGNKLEYAFTPMVGGVVGTINGISPGLEFALIYNKLELYSESEYFFDVNSKEGNYYYNWSDLTYSFNDNFWGGISAQRTRLYQTDLEIQRGIFVGGAYKQWEVTGYLYNLFFDDPYVLATLSYNF